MVAVLSLATYGGTMTMLLARPASVVVPLAIAAPIAPRVIEVASIASMEMRLLAEGNYTLKGKRAAAIVVESTTMTPDGCRIRGWIQIPGMGPSGFFWVEYIAKALQCGARATHDFLEKVLAALQNSAESGTAAGQIFRDVVLDVIEIIAVFENMR
jgi:hypothetical protein